ncbi:MAG TPA: hypothetical protein IAB58_04410 [Candidatus Pelethosoma merdigallinarum]|nr:hypothetical protein [Candidatus Pelethosoma merdigallinarum]
MEIAFHSLEELYTRLKPALRTKKEEMRRHGFTYIKEEDIWNYFKEKKWKTAYGLQLHEMVDDILNCEDEFIEDYVKDKLNLKNRTVYFDNESRR